MVGSLYNLRPAWWGKSSLHRGLDDGALWLSSSSWRHSSLCSSWWTGSLASCGAFSLSSLSWCHSSLWSWSAGLAGCSGKMGLSAFQSTFELLSVSEYSPISTVCSSSLPQPLIRLCKWRCMISRSACHLLPHFFACIRCDCHPCIEGKLHVQYLHRNDFTIPGDVGPYWLCSSVGLSHHACDCFFFVWIFITHTHVTLFSHNHPPFPSLSPTMSNPTKTYTLQKQLIPQVNEGKNEDIQEPPRWQRNPSWCQWQISG